MSPPEPQLFLIMLKKPQVAVKLEKLFNALVPTAAVAPLINGVSFEEQLLGQLLQQLTKLFKLYWNLMKLFRTPLPPR